MEQVRTRYVRQDLVDFQRLHAKTVGRRRMRLQRGLAVVIGLLGTVGGIISVRGIGEVTLGCVLCILIGLVFLAWACLYHQIAGWSVQRMLGPDARDNTFTFEEEGIEVQTGQERAQLPYEVIVQWAEDRRQLALFYGPDRGIFLPKRDIQDLEALKVFLADKLSSPLQSFC